MPARRRPIHHPVLVKRFEIREQHVPEMSLVFFVLPMQRLNPLRLLEAILKHAHGLCGSHVEGRCRRCGRLLPAVAAAES